MYKTKEKVDTKEKLVSALETISTVVIVNKDDFLGLGDWTQEFTRILNITINDREYKIRWYHNLCNLNSEWCEIPFDSITLTSPTWPVEVGSNLKLQLERDGITVAII